MHTLAYGPDSSHVGDLYLPTASDAPVVCLFHGGFWRLPYDRSELAPVARDLCERGFAVWNVEYRRIGGGVPGWPATFHDVEAAIAHLPTLREAYPRLDLRRVILVGHSAGGHLAFWAASRIGAGGRPSAVKIVAVVGLAPLLDLHAAHDLGLGQGAVEAFLGGPPSELADRYRMASPRSLLPLRTRQCLMHGDADAAVPISLSRSYVDAALRSGDDAELIELRGADHMSFLDATGPAHARLCGFLSLVAGRSNDAC